MRSGRPNRVTVLAGAGLIALAVASAASATIPDAGGVYTACRLNSTGTIRLIDPSGPSSSLLSRCTSLETQFAWNQRGQKGEPGAPGAAGAPGADGVAPGVSQLLVGDAHCPGGGAAITDAAGSRAYVCSGADGRDGAAGRDGTAGRDGVDGKDGAPFSGTFTSPNGTYAIRVADDGVSITGAGGTSVRLADGDVTVRAFRNLTLEGGLGATVRAPLAKVEAAGTLDLSAGGAITVDGALVRIGPTRCLPAARYGDPLLTTPAFSGQITGGSATVCIGG